MIHYRGKVYQNSGNRAWPICRNHGRVRLLCVPISNHLVNLIRSCHLWYTFWETRSQPTNLGPILPFFFDWWKSFNSLSIVKTSQPSPASSTSPPSRDLGPRVIKPKKVIINPWDSLCQGRSVPFPLRQRRGSNKCGSFVFDMDTKVAMWQVEACSCAELLTAQRMGHGKQLVRRE